MQVKFTNISETDKLNKRKRGIALGNRPLSIYQNSA